MERTAALMPAGALRGTLVFHHNGIGDYVMGLPAMRLLSAAAPRPIDVVTGNVEAASLYDELDVDGRITTQVRPGRFAHRLDVDHLELRGSYGFFVSLATWDGPELRSLAQRSGARTVAGLFSWCNWRVARSPAHDMARLFGIARAFSPGAEMSAWLWPPRRAGISAGPEPAVTRPGRPLLTVHAQTRPEKMWVLSRYDEVLAAFLDSHSHWDVALIGLADTAVPRASATGRVRCVQGASLLSAMRVVAESQLFLGVDSCMLHVADLSGVPGVALFGPTSPEQFGYCCVPGDLHRNLRAGNRMADLPAAAVLQALRVLADRVS